MNTTILGLSIAIGCAIVAYAFVDYDLSVDQFHENKDRIFMTTSRIDRDGSLQTFGFSPTPLGTSLGQDFPEIQRVARVEGRNGIVKYKDGVFSERIRFVDPEFLQMFTFPLKWGEASGLQNPYEIILSEEMAIKYFGQQNPVEEIISIDFGSGHKFEYTVSGVAQAFPNPSEFAFDFLINIEQLTQADPQFDLTDWASFVDATFYEVRDGEDVAELDNRMAQYFTIQNSVQPDFPIQKFRSEPFSTIRANGMYIRSRITGNADPEGQIIISIIGILLIVLACFNYINIAIVSASKRLKEIGIRKVMGGHRTSIFIQFIGENMLLMLLACVIGLILAKTIFVPAFDNMFVVGIEFKLTSPELWIFLVGTLLFTGFISGAYPALYISKFNATNILRGKLKFQSRNYLTKVFLGCQFVLSCLALVSSIFFVQNSNYQQKRDWGYNQKQVLVTPVPDQASFEQLRNELSQNPNIIEISGSRHHLGAAYNSAVIDLPDRKFETMNLKVDGNYVPTMGLRIKEGRNFQKELAMDKQHVIVNERMVKALGWEDPINQQFKHDSVQYTVIGVVEDHHHYSFYVKIFPSFYQVAAPEDYRYLSMKVEAGKTIETFEELKSTWASLFPQLPFNGQFQDQYFEYYFNNIAGHGKLMSFIAFLAIVLSCMGLYGLLSLNIASRTKEFSVRKVLGAETRNMIPLINRQFIWILLIACLIGAPVSYYLIRFLFDNVYEYHMPLTVIPVIWAVGILIALVSLTSLSQIRKVIRINPIDGLRQD